MTSERRLIVNADDFGLSKGVNTGILEAHERGIVTSTSLMVYADEAEWAAEIAQWTLLSVGVHLDMGEWYYAAGEWKAQYERAPLDNVHSLEKEVDAQLERFVRLMGSAPTHIDSHQHVHQREPLRSIAIARAAELGIPVRHFTQGITYRGDFYGQDESGNRFPDRISAEFLISLVESLPIGATELCCHPADTHDFGGMYRDERLEELESLCDPRVIATIKQRGIELVGFDSLGTDH